MMLNMDRMGIALRNTPLLQYPPIQVQEVLRYAAVITEFLCCKHPIHLLPQNSKRSQCCAAKTHYREIRGQYLKCPPTIN